MQEALTTCGFRGQQLTPAVKRVMVNFVAARFADRFAPAWPLWETRQTFLITKIKACMQRIRRSAAKRHKVQLNTNMIREYGKRAKAVVPKKSKSKQTLKTDDDDEQVGDYDIATVDVPIQDDDDDMDDDDQEQRAVEGDDGQSNEEEQAEAEVEGDDGQNIEEEQGEGEADDGHEMVDVELLLDQGATSDQEEQGSATD
jgi:hypothetical protein